MPEPVEGPRRYVPGLDGLRAVAVLAVIGFHLSVAWLPGGLLGVGVFFVLSGYLITDLLVSQYRHHGRIDFKDFWGRRARRLLPALFVMLFVVVGWATVLDRGQLPSLRSGLLAAVFYLSNWWFIYHHVSYFARFGPPSPIGHLWSLAVEEQFYLLWPVMVLAGMRFAHRRRARLVIVVSMAAASALEMGLLYSPGADPTRVYDGTDTRAFALLIGAGLALAWPRERVVGVIKAGARRVLEAAGGVALAGVVAMFWFTDQYEPFLYQGGVVLLSVLTAVVIAVVVHPGARLGRLLGVRPLRWIGKRSYAIYLWHYPVIVLTTPPGAPSSPARVFLQLLASFLFAALSWRYVEDPVRRGALRRVVARVRARPWSLAWSPPRLRSAVILAAAANGVLCVLGLAGVLAAPALAPASKVTSILPRVSHGRTGASGGPSATTTTRGLGNVPATELLPDLFPRPVAPPATLPPAWPAAGAPFAVLFPPDLSPPATLPATTTTTTTPPPAGEGVTAIGDSVMIDAAPYLERLLPGIEIDARIGQQLYRAAAAVPKLRAEGVIGSRVIIELGTNGSYRARQLVALLRSLGHLDRVVLVNIRVLKPWQASVNATIAAVAKDYPHATVANWYAVSAHHPGYFSSDGVHLTPAGAARYASLLVGAVDGPGRAASR